MRSPYLISAVIILLGLGGILLTYELYLPALAHNVLERELGKIGLAHLKLPAPEKGRDYILYHDIPLDEDDLDHIDELAIQYSLTGLISNQRFKKIHIKGLSLTGSLDILPNQNLDIPGWKKTDIFYYFKDLPTDELDIKDFRLALLTKAFGGITLKTDLQTKRFADYIDVQTTIESHQRYLSFSMKGSGRIHPQNIIVEMELMDGKFDWQDLQIQASRAHGALTVEHSPETYRLKGDFQMGGAQVLGMPWQNVSATFEANKQYFKLFAGGKSVGIDGLEMGMDIYRITGKPYSVSGFIHFDAPKNYIDFHTVKSHLKLSDPQAGYLKTLEGLESHIALQAIPETGKGDFKVKLSHKSLSQPISENVTINFTKKLNGSELLGPALQKISAPK